MVAVCCGPLVCHSPSAVEVTSAMGAKMLYGRGMPQPYIFSDPLVRHSFFGG